MLKIRLHGTSEEIAKAVKLFDKLEEEGVVEVLNCSGAYADRGKSRYARVYMDVEVREEK